MLKRIEQVEVRQLIKSRSEARLRPKHGGLLAEHPGRAGAFVAKEVKRRMESVPKILSSLLHNRAAGKSSSALYRSGFRTAVGLSRTPAPLSGSANQVRVLPA